MTIVKIQQLIQIDRKLKYAESEVILQNECCHIHVCKNDQ